MDAATGKSNEREEARRDSDSSRYTADRAKFVFGQEMKACPKCGGFNIGYSTPIKLDDPLPGTAKGMLAAWAKARKGGATPLEGTCRIMCRACGHLGPAVNVTGRTAEDVGRDKAVADETKRLWNSEPNDPGEKSPAKINTLMQTDSEKANGSSEASDATAGDFSPRISSTSFVVRIPPPKGWVWQMVENGETFAVDACRLRNLNGGYDEPVCRWERAYGASQGRSKVIVPAGDADLCEGCGDDPASGYDGPGETRLCAKCRSGLSNKIDEPHGQRENQ